MLVLHFTFKVSKLSRCSSICIPVCAATLLLLGFFLLQTLLKNVSLNFGHLSPAVLITPALSLSPSPRLVTLLSFCPSPDYDNRILIRQVINLNPSVT